MKKDIVEILDFEEEKPKVGRPKLADKNTKRKSLIIASLSFFAVILLLIFGYGTLFGYKDNNLLASLTKTNSSNQNILIEEINPIIEDITLKEGTARKVYLTVLPANASNKNIIYKSNNEKVAVVDNQGKVTAIKEGKTKIIATTSDGSLKEAIFNVKVIKNADGKCSFKSIEKSSDKLDYELECDNAKIKEIQYKVGNSDYEKLLTKKLSDTIKFSDVQLKKKITLKVVYYPNNSKVSKYVTKVVNNVTTTKPVTGSCSLDIVQVSTNSAKYDITCDNATVSKLAYKIGNGSYIGIDSSSLADTILFEESDVTRQLYFNIEYLIDGTTRTKTVTKSAIIQKVLEQTNESISE